jgi:putative ABC transport system permease protein
MKYAKFIWKNAIRNKRRAILTVLSVAIAILAVSVLGAVLHAFRAGVEMADESRLVMRNAVSIIFPLPISYANRIGRMNGVKSVTWGNWFGGNYQDDKRNFFPKFAVDAESYFPMYPEYLIPEDQYRDFLADRRGCIVGKKLADRFGLKVGQSIPIPGDIYPGTWDGLLLPLEVPR